MNLEDTTVFVTQLLYRVATVPQTLFTVIMVRLLLARETRVANAIAQPLEANGVEQTAMFVPQQEQGVLLEQLLNLVRLGIASVPVHLFLSRM